MDKARGAKGFEMLVGKRIIKVNDQCVNFVVLTMDDGSTYELDAEMMSTAMPIPVMEVKEVVYVKEQIFT